MCTMLQTPPSASGVLHPPPPGAAAGVPVSAGSPHQAAAAAAAAAAGAANLFPTFLQGSPPPGVAPGATHLGSPHDPLFPHLPHHQMHHPHHPQLPPHHLPLSHPPFLPPEPPKPRFLFRMPRVVPNQKEKFESDDLMKRHTREGEVRYTAFRDRPLAERQQKFIGSLREGHLEIAFIGTGFNLVLTFNPLHSFDPRLRQMDFEKEPGKVHLRSNFILNGVCVRWKGYLDLERLDGVGCLEFDEETAKIEDVILREQVEAYNRRMKEFEEHRKQQQQHIAALMGQQQAVMAAAAAAASRSSTDSQAALASATTTTTTTVEEQSVSPSSAASSRLAEATSSSTPTAGTGMASDSLLLPSSSPSSSSPAASSNNNLLLLGQSFADSSNGLIHPDLLETTATKTPSPPSLNSSGNTGHASSSSGSGGKTQQQQQQHQLSSPAATAAAAAAMFKHQQHLSLADKMAAGEGTKI